jgi:hypothetical protein
MKWRVSTSGVDHAESVALRVGHDHVVGVGWPLGPVDLGRAQGLQPLHLRGLVVGVQIEMNPRRDLEPRVDSVERDVRAVTGSGVEQDEIGARRARVLARDVSESCRPECRLAWQIVDADHDRADTQHLATIIRRRRITRCATNGRWRLGRV